jgi:hypothetical protein
MLTALRRSIVPAVHRPSGRSEKEPGRKHVMLMTRGTRGDVQPFLALARGLILNHGCKVTVVTELAWKKFVKTARQDLPDGSLVFLPSGGNTMLKVGSDVSRFFINRGQHLDALQALMFSRSEVEFFTSEGCFYHWAWKENPDFLVFGFTITHIAMIISEALSIPLVGFVLQPAREIEPRSNPITVFDQMAGPVRELVTGKEFNAVLQQVMDRLPSGLTINALRTSRGLRQCSMSFESSFPQFDVLVQQGVPLVVPINLKVLGEQVQEDVQRAGLTLTDFIFLRLGSDELDSQVLDFLTAARTAGRQILAMTFSSMPVGEKKMLEVAMRSATTVCLQ